ncbi:MAG: hypothetical protein ACKVTZ_03195, partial [Bacteroidia bacterium]
RIVLNEFIEVKGWKALGNKLDVKNKVLAVRGLESVEQLAQKQMTLPIGAQIEWNEKEVKVDEKGQVELFG